MPHILCTRPTFSQKIRENNSYKIMWNKSLYQSGIKHIYIYIYGDGDTTLLYYK